MSASPEVMAANGGKPPQGAPPGPPGMQPGQTPPPSAAPMLSPQKKEGTEEDGAVNAMLAKKLLERALPAFGTSDAKGQAILKALTALAKAFGKDESSTEELTPAEKMQMLQGLAGPGQPPQGKPPGGAPPQGAGAPPPPGA